MNNQLGIVKHSYVHAEERGDLMNTIEFKQTSRKFWSLFIINSILAVATTSWIVYTVLKIVG